MPLKISGEKNMILHDNVAVQYRTWLAAVPIMAGEDCVLEIGAGTVIGNFNHIYATKSIILGKNVLTADKVYISDNQHGYADINVPIMLQEVIQKNEVVIGDGTWLGENVCVLGARIGRNCVIGANSVVTKDIPDYCIAVGAPARIVKRFCLVSNEWKPTELSGAFKKID